MGFNADYRNSREYWGRVSRWLHWSMVLLILTAVILGWWAKTASLSPLKLDLFVWHKSVGMLILLLVVLRLLWRMANVTPELLSATPLERRAARLLQGGLYVLMVLIPLSGWVITSAAHIPVRVFWLLPLPPLVAADKHLALLAKQVHATCLVIFMLLLLLHIAAAFRHHFILRNHILKRMWLW
jgi:cytochrome b561